MQIALATWIGHLAVSLIGRSVRWETIGWENFEAAQQAGKGLIFACWHCEIFSATWFWRNRSIAIMISENFDGEYVARIVRKHGFVPTRGSSSRSAARVLVRTIQAMRKGNPGGVTPDGPRGPRHIAKPGIVLLAKATGAAIVCFHIVPRRTWVLRKSWDRTEIPRPFTRAAVLIAPPLTVSPQAGAEEQAGALRSVQETFEELERKGEAWRLEKGN